jgi:hypothetical protein
MSALNATVFAVNGQGYRLPCAFVDTSGNLITGWTGATATAYPDNGSGASVTIAESPVGSGVGYIDIPATQMSCSMCMVVATVTNANMTAFKAAVRTMNLGKFTGRYDAQAVILFEQMLQDVFILLGANGASQTGAALSFQNPDGSNHFGGTVTQNATSGTRSLMQ